MIMSEWFKVEYLTNELKTGIFSLYRQLHD